MDTTKDILNNWRLGLPDALIVVVPQKLIPLVRPDEPPLSGFDSSITRQVYNFKIQSNETFSLFRTKLWMEFWFKFLILTYHAQDSLGFPKQIL